MKRFIHLVLPILLLASAFTFTQSKEELPPAIAGLSKLIGGKWVGEVGPESSRLKVEYEYKWHPDKKGIVGEGVIGKGSTNPVHTHVTLGWDARANKVYYLDTHNTDTVYFGHVTLDGVGFLFEFGPIGGDLKSYRSRESFVEADTFASEILDKNGKTIAKFQLKRVT